MPETPPTTRTHRRRWAWLIVLFLAAACLAAITALLVRGRAEPATPIAIAPARNSGASNAADSSETVEVSMAEMLQLAEDALAETLTNLDDYTARLIKQEQDRSGVLQPASEMTIKVITRQAGDQHDGPLKVYLRFDSPSSVRGREVIWVENENDGKMLVREAGVIGTMMTVPLPPDGFLAMQGQRYPISELGLTKLLEKLIERGNEDRNDPDVHVFLTEGYLFDGRPLTHLRIERSKPSGRDNDFAVAELVLDRPNNLVVSFRSFGWPPPDSAERPLIESYEYHDLKTNVGLTTQDFDITNPDYDFAQ